MKEELASRFAILAASVGVDSRDSNVFGEVVVLNDGSSATDGVFGCSYAFANGDSYKCGVFGYKKTTGNDVVKPEKTTGSGVRVTQRTTRSGTYVRSSINTSGSVYHMGDVSGSRTVINGVDYTDRIPDGASITLTDEGVFVNGKRIDKP